MSDHESKMAVAQPGVHSASQVWVDADGYQQHHGWFRAPLAGVYSLRWAEGILHSRIVRVTSDPNPLPPRIHLFRFPRRELALWAGCFGSGLLAARYGLSVSEGVLAAAPLVAGWVAGEVVG